MQLYRKKSKMLMVSMSSEVHNAKAIHSSVFTNEYQQLLLLWVLQLLLLLSLVEPSLF